MCTQAEVLSVRPYEAETTQLEVKALSCSGLRKTPASHTHLVPHRFLEGGVLSRMKRDGVVKKDVSLVQLALRDGVPNFEIHLYVYFFGRSSSNVGNTHFSSCRTSYAEQRQGAPAMCSSLFFKEVLSVG